MRCGHHFGGSHRLVVISRSPTVPLASLVRVDRDVLYNDLLLSATSMVIKPPTILEPAINLKTAKAIGVDRAASFLLGVDNLIE
jgi:hypothetical protein